MESGSLRILAFFIEKSCTKDAAVKKEKPKDGNKYKRIEKESLLLKRDGFCIIGTYQS